MTRRRALTRFGSLVAASPFLPAQEGPKLIGEPPGRIAPREELVNTFEFEAMAERKLNSAAYREIAGGERAAFDRITFRPRMLVNVSKLDLTVELFGEKLFAPILAGPASHQQRFHPEAEAATVRGASAAKAVAVISSRASLPLDRIAAEAKAGFWYQVFPEPDLDGVRTRLAQAVRAGCKAVCITVGTPDRPAGNPGLDWRGFDRLRQGLTVPVVLKGIMSAEEARKAVEQGAQGIIVSNHGGRFVPGLAAPIEVLASIVDAAGERVPVLIDGGFRRGTDILKALAFGARAVLVTRPVLWGLAAYGADGVQTVLEMLQTELARNMGLAGKPTLKDLDRTLLKIHRR